MAIIHLGWIELKEGRWAKDWKGKLSFCTSKTFSQKPHLVILDLISLFRTRSHSHTSLQGSLGRSILFVYLCSLGRWGRKGTWKILNKKALGSATWLSSPSLKKKGNGFHLLQLNSKPFQEIYWIVSIFESSALAYCFHRRGWRSVRICWQRKDMIFGN